MQVHKFGGASLGTIDRIRNVAHIIREHTQRPSLIVISAMGKTTNALEKVAEAFFDGRRDDALALFHQVKQQHINTAKYLLVLHYNACVEQLNNFFTEAEWLLHDRPVRDYDYYYDQLVCIGELLSSTLVSFYLKEEKIDNEWLDVRDVLRTDANFREATINWPATDMHMQTQVQPLLQKTGLVITQGFIGCTDDNESTTLGREGSDYSAAIFANLLQAESQTIWKDVSSVMNADPRQFEEVIPIPELSYEEVIEMAYYGAQVIHPKTIKPLYEKKIPLYVKCFLDPNMPGTVITRKKATHLPPIIVRKEHQVLVEFQSRDYSFIGEHSVGQLFQLFEQVKLKPNLTQNGAIRFTAIFDDHLEKLQHIASEAEAWLNVMMQKQLTLFTVRHYTEEVLNSLIKDRQLLLMQRTPDTAQFLVQN
ncbi:MAG: aspartate kinase [Chitinophagaceae bacterium]|jgi:aspartate kinase|nr:aspartate kinase [Chitinophagaceae bacterium]